MHIYCIPLAILVATFHASSTAPSSLDRPVSDLIHDVAQVEGGAALGAVMVCLCAISMCHHTRLMKRGCLVSLGFSNRLSGIYLYDWLASK